MSGMLSGKLHKTVPLLKWLILAMASGVMCACSHAESGRSFSGNWREAEARDIAAGIARSWRFSPDDFQGTPPNQLQTNVDAVLPFDKNTVERRLVLISVTPQDYTCHACAPVTGGVLFARDGGVWKAVYDQADIVKLGANGKPPAAHAEQVGRDHPMIAFELASMAQGASGTTLTLVAEVGGKLKEVLSLDTAGSNEGAGLAADRTYAWQSKLEFIQPSNSDFPDIRVVSSGTKDTDDGSVKPYSATVVYRFNDQSYKPSTQ